ncbi:MAG: response regulator [Acidobacteria bacterium]|nr:response regulator [Acidobacteriota bacterium]
MHRALLIAAALALTCALYAVSRVNYLLFHVAIEVAGAIVAVTIFSIGWNTRRFVRNDLLLTLSTAYLPVALLDLVHALAYRGMGVFPGYTTDLPTQLWIAARILECASLLVAGAWAPRERAPAPWTLLAGWCAAGAALLASVFVGLFPACYVEGSGLTPFKMAAEYLLAAGFAAAAWIFWRRRGALSSRLMDLLAAGALAKVGSELSLAVYTDVYGQFNFLGHVLKLLSIALVYRAVVSGSLSTPYESLFRGLARSEQELKDELEIRRRAETELKQAKQVAEQATLATGEFLTHVSHEIRTPMNAIVGAADLALSTRLTPEQHDYLRVVRTSADALLRVVNDVIDLAKVRAGRLEFEEVVFDPQQVVSGSLEPFMFEAARKEIQLDAQVAVAVPRSLAGDAGRLRQVLINLVGNAVKFTPHGRVVVSVGLEARDDNTCLLRFSVADTGPGIPPGRLDELFLPFGQVSDSLSARKAGSGLGLAISQQIVARMGGRVWAESELGRGSTFHFTARFRLALAGERDAPAPEADEAERAATGLTILVAEDHPINREVAELLLQQRGWQVRATTNGREAIEALESGRYDAVLMDVQMPETDGLTATREIRRREDETGRPRVPIIALTAHALSGDREMCLAAGMDDYLAKPVHPPLLFAKIERWTRGAGAAGEGSPADLSSLQRALGGDPEAIAKLVQGFLEDVPPQLQRVEDALERGDRVALEREAHQIQGSVGVFGARAACELALRVEDLARGAGNEEELRRGAAELVEEVRRVCRFLSETGARR